MSTQNEHMPPQGLTLDWKGGVYPNRSRVGYNGDVSPISQLTAEGESTNGELPPFLVAREEVLIHDVIPPFPVTPQTSPILEMLQKHGFRVNLRGILSSQDPNQMAHIRAVQTKEYRYKVDSMIAKLLKEAGYKHDPSLDVQSAVSILKGGSQFAGVNGKVFLYLEPYPGVGPLLTATPNPQVLGTIMHSYEMHTYHRRMTDQLDTYQMKKAIGRVLGLVKMERNEKGERVEVGDSGYLPYETQSVVPVAYLARSEELDDPVVLYFPDSNGVYAMHIPDLRQVPLATVDHPAHVGRMVSDYFSY